MILATHYRAGIRKLLLLAGYDHRDIEALLILYHRLVENLDNTLMHGDTSMLKTDRVHILHYCDVFCQAATGGGFAPLCELPESVVQQGVITTPDPVAEVQEQTLLDTYLLEMRDMLLREGLLFEGSGGTVRRAARERTLSLLPTLNGSRKGYVIRFLYGTELIFRTPPILSLDGAMLEGAILEGAHLAWSSLGDTDLSASNLAWANLMWANLEGALLQGANLFMSDLSKVNLRGADLREANLYHTVLEKSEYNAYTRWPNGFDPANAGAIKVSS